MTNYIFGFDFFISYAHADALAYAECLAARLKDQGFECFLDLEDYAAGDDWKKAGRVALRRTGRLILVGSPAALRSGPVLREVNTFRERHRRIIPIDVGNTLADAGDTALLQAIGSATIRIPESGEALTVGPSDDVVNHLRDSFDLTRQHQRRQRVLTGATIVFAVLAVLAVALAWQAYLDRRTALAARDRAERETRRVKASELAARSDQVQNQFPQRSVLLAVEAMHVTGQDGIRTAVAEQALRDGLNRFPANALSPVGDRLTWVDITADARWLVARDRDGTAWLWDLTAKDPGRGGVMLDGQVADRDAIQLSRDGRRLAAGGADGGVRLWDLGLETPWKTPTVLKGHHGAISAVAFGRHSRWLATAGHSGRVAVWDLDAGRTDPTRVLSWHNTEETVRQLRLSPDNRWLVGRSTEGTAVLWDLNAAEAAASGRPLLDEPHHAADVAISPDARWLFVLSDEDTVWSWDLAAPHVAESRMPFTEWENGISAMMTSADSHWLVTPTHQGYLLLWDLTAGIPGNRATILWEWEGLEEDPWQDRMDVSISADGRWLTGIMGNYEWGLWDLGVDDPAAVRRIGSLGTVLNDSISADGRVVAAVEEGRLVIMNPASEADDNTDMPNRVLPDIRPHPTAPLAISDVRVSAAARWVIADTADGKAWLWDLDNHAQKDWIDVPGHEGRVDQVVVSSDSRWLLARSGNGTARLWDIEATARQTPPMTLTGDWARFNKVALSADGRWLYTETASNAYRWNLQRTSPFSGQPLVLDGRVVFSHDGRWMVSQRRGGSLALWDLLATPSSAPVRELGLHGEGLYDTSIDVRGGWLRIERDRRRAWLYDVSDSGSPRPRIVLHEEFLQPEEAVVSPNGHWLALRTGDGIAGLLDLSAADPPATAVELPHDNAEVTAMAIAPDGRWMATGTARGRVRLWDLTAQRPMAAPQDLDGHRDEILRFRFSPSGRWMVTDSRDNNAYLWDLRLSPPPRRGFALTGGGRPVHPLPFSGDDRWLVTRGEDGITRLWDLAARDPLTAMTILSNKDALIVHVRMLPGNRWMVTKNDKEKWHLWDLQAEDPARSARTLRAHEGELRSILFSPDGTRFATIEKGADVIRLWDLDAPDPLQSPILLQGHRDEIKELTFSPDGRWLVSLSRDRTVRLWPIHSDHLLDLARRTAGRNLSPQEWDLYFPGAPYRKTFPDLPNASAVQ